MKKRVSRAILEDMKKYIPDFDPSQYEVTNSGETDPSVLLQLRVFYDTHLPADLEAWFRVNEPKKSLIFKDAYNTMYSFILFQALYLVLPTKMERIDNPLEVIGSYVIKSVKLPECRITNKKYGLEIIIRYNCQEWLVTINSEKPLDFDYDPIFKLFSRTGYEGFSNSAGSYNKDHSHFKAKFNTSYNLYTFLFIMMNYIKTH